MRKIYLTILFILICSISFAQVLKDQFFIIEDFSKMLQSHVSLYNGDDKSASEAINLRVNEQFGSLVKRDVLLSYGSCSTSAVDSLHRYYKSDATKYLLINSGTSLYLGSDTGAACTTLKSGLSSGKKWSWITYKDIAIGTNGYDRPQKYDGKSTTTSNTDGARTASELTTELGAPFAELDDGSGGNDLDASSWYQYKVAFYDGTNISYSTARSNPILTGSTVQNLRLTDIPLGPSGTTARYIYRTVGNASKAAVLADTSYYKVTTISDNSTTTYSDAVTDATLLGDASPTWTTASAGINVTPPISKYALVHRERIWLANDPTATTTYGKSTVYFSKAYYPDYFLNTDYFLITPDDGDEITFISQFLGVFTVGKTNTISKIGTDDTSTSNWYILPPTSFIGCIAPYSAQSTPIGIIYLSKDGLFKFNGQSSQLISDSVTKEIRDISPANWSNVVGFYHDNEYYLAYTSSSSGSSTNNRTLIYNLVRDAYVKDYTNISSFEVFDSGSDFGTMYSGSSTTDGKVLAHSSDPNVYTIKYKSELDAGTTDSATVDGTEELPTLELGWGITIDSSTLDTITLDAVTYDTAIIDRPSTTGYWYSPVLRIDASTLTKLYWSVNEGSTGTTTLAIRTDNSATTILTNSWSSELTNPSGSDVSGTTGYTYIQFRVKMTTSDINYTPQLYLQDDFVIKLTYSRVGVAGETSMFTLWKSQWVDLSSQASNYPKMIKEMDVYYEGTSGTLNVSIENLKGDSTASFTIDLSQSRNPSLGYFGNDDSKVFRYNFPVVPTATNALIGDKFQVSVSDIGTTSYKIQRIVIRYDVLDYVNYR